MVLDGILVDLDRVMTDNVVPDIKNITHIVADS